MINTKEMILLPKNKVKQQQRSIICFVSQHLTKLMACVDKHPITNKTDVNKKNSGAGVQF